MDTKDAFVDTLQRIRSVALSKAAHIQKLASCSKPSKPSTTHVIANIPDLSLPTPQDITSALLKMGCPSMKLAQAVSDAYCKKGGDLRMVCLSNHKASCRKAAQLSNFDPGAISSYQRLVPILEKDYRTELADLRQKYVDSVRKRFSRASPDTSDQGSNSCSFKPNSLPILEKWFKHNPYPNAEERSVLARKSRMTSRQIEVWFQNHRTRAKKEGRMLQKQGQDALDHLIQRPLTPPAESTESFEAPALSVSTVVEPVTKEPRVRSPSPQTVHATALVSSPPPSYAFPLPFVARKFERTPFPPPVWYRRPAQSSSPNKVKKSDLDSLCTDMTAKLHLRSPSKKPDSSEPQSTKPWIGSLLIPYTPAPHPALIRSPKPASLKRKRSRNISEHRSEAPQQTFTSSLATPQRKIARLPHHLSSNSSDRATAPSNNTSPSSSSQNSHESTLSRQSSSSSLSSTKSRRRLSTSSSSSSSASSTINTPNQEQIDLPDAITFATNESTFGFDEPPDYLSMLNFSPPFNSNRLGKAGEGLNLLSMPDTLPVWHLPQ